MIRPEYKGPIFTEKIRDNAKQETWITQWGLVSVIAHDAGVDLVMKRTNRRTFFRINFRKHKQFGYGVIYAWEPKLGVRDLSFDNLQNLLFSKICQITIKTNDTQPTLLVRKVKGAIRRKLEDRFLGETGVGSLESTLCFFVTPLIAKPGASQNLILCPKGVSRTAFRYSDSEVVLQRLFPTGTNKRIRRAFYQLIGAKDRYLNSLIGHLQIAHDLAVRKGYGLDFAANYLQDVAENPNLVSRSVLRSSGMIKGLHLKVFWRLIASQYQAKTNVKLLMEHAYSYHIMDTFENLKRLEQANRLDLMSFRRKPSWEKLHDDAVYAVVFLDRTPFDFEYNTFEKSIHGFVCNEYEFILPKRNFELRKWGLDFRNCVGSYANGVKDGRYLITGIKKDGKFCIVAQWNRRFTRIMHAELPRAQAVPHYTLKQLEEIANNDFRKALQAQGENVPR